ncbi:hypothetical protein PBCV1_a020R [Paramecium bursaria Chlorella virus 1]|uniref:Uncharacterized protein n=1 Tax=Paramecium bursaria Chlorella virus 1 TaxID=10506 RepID=Q89355_PBCV1|nr:hypothetical protein PBCV1_a020R [Paramecium bursaria Chlorella virus 1]AAC96388.1 hypothetical protein [Paramecium bursaria Chlorella virus 1]
MFPVTSNIAKFRIVAVLKKAFEATIFPIRFPTLTFDVTFALVAVKLPSDTLDNSIRVRMLLILVITFENTLVMPNTFAFIVLIF